MSRGQDDDISGFMANVIGGQSDAMSSSAEASRSKKRSNLDGSKTFIRTGGHFKRIYRYLILAPILAAFVIVLIYFLWKGPLESILKPPSPFTQAQQEKMGIPLYFPTKLPGTYKIETDNIAESDVGVIIYAATDEEGNRINFTLQKQPENIELDEFFSALSDVKELETKFGKVKFGVASGNRSIANVFTGQTWVIINSNKDILDDTTLTDLINSLDI